MSIFSGPGAGLIPDCMELKDYLNCATEEIQLNFRMENVPDARGNIGHWLGLVEYAHRRGLSLSTLRRHIKSGKLTHQLRQGRYYIWDELDADSSNPSLRSELAKAREEIAELRTLIAVYEENSHPLRDAHL